VDIPTRILTASLALSLTVSGCAGARQPGVGPVAQGKPPNTTDRGAPPASPVPSDAAPPVSLTPAGNDEQKTHRQENRFRPFLRVPPGRASSSSSQPLSFEADLVPVYYVTDRDRGLPSEAFFSSRKAPGLHYGTASVAIPTDHRTGAPDDRLRVQIAAESTRDQFFKDLKNEVLRASQLGADGQIHVRGFGSQLERLRERQLSVFVHGCSNSFEDSAQLTAQLWYDLGSVGPVVLYAWPSQGNIDGCGRSDEETSEWTARHLEAFLLDMTKAVPDFRVNVIGHSFGAGSVIRALAHIARSRHGSPLLKEVVLIASAMEADIFDQLSADVIEGNVANRLTLYVSSGDVPLFLKAIQTDHLRRGQSPISRTAGIEVIDATPLADFASMNHSYFVQDSRVLVDLFYLLEYGYPASARFGIFPITERVGSGDLRILFAFK
jgi:esterase/lipase superfamily enzyme